MAAEVFEGHERLVALNHETPAVAELVERALRHWLERGVDGWRLDAAYVTEVIERGGSPRSEYFDQMRRQTIPPQVTPSPAFLAAGYNDLPEWIQ